MTEKALLVVSFGTSYADTRERTIGAIENRMAERFPDRTVRRAWTSSFLIKKVAKTEGLIVDTPQEAMQRLAESGVTDLIVQPTHLSDGFENRRMLDIVKENAGRFETVSVGRPLLFREEDRKAVARLMPELYLEKRFPGAMCPDGKNDDGADPDGGSALLLMGHGSAKHPVPVYEQLQQVFTEEGADNIFVGTVEGRPTFEEAEERLKRSGYRKVVLAPLMIVAGDHALHDMAGESPDSWESRLQADGFSTCASMTGLGEYTQIQDIFLQHAMEAERI